MALEINQNRVFKAPVTVFMIGEDGKEKTGKFSAMFKSLKVSDFENKDVSLLDLVLVDVADLVVLDDEGNALQGQELVDAVKDDSDLASACVDAFNLAMEKKAQKRKTLSTASTTSSTEAVEPPAKK
jgi:hypothetical protein